MAPTAASPPFVASRAKLPGGLVVDDHPVGDEPDQAAPQVFRLYGYFAADGSVGIQFMGNSVREGLPLLVEIDDQFPPRRHPAMGAVDVHGIVVIGENVLEFEICGFLGHGALSFE